MEYPQLINPPQRKKHRLVISIILFCFAGLWFAGSIGWFFILSPATENNTTEFTATISAIHPVTFYRISTIEHDVSLLIFDERTVLDVTALNSLEIGQLITFRVRNRNVDNNTITDTRATPILVALSHNGIDIITLESYNAHQNRIQTTLGFAAGGIITLSLAIACLLWYKNAQKRPTQPLN